MNKMICQYYIYNISAAHVKLRQQLIISVRTVCESVHTTVLSDGRSYRGTLQSGPINYGYLRVNATSDRPPDDPTFSCQSNSSNSIHAYKWYEAFYRNEVRRIRIRRLMNKKSCSPTVIAVANSHYLARVLHTVIL
jgi:hypothetical protein